MVTYEQATSRLGLALARLLELDDPVPDEVLDRALAARVAALTLVRTWQHEGRLGTGTANRSIEEFASNPVAVLNALRDRVPEAPAPPDEHRLLVDEPDTPTARTWASVHRNAVTATHLWNASDPRTRPHPATSWPLVADAAAITRAVLSLDPHIAAAARRVDRDDAAALDDPRSPAVILLSEHVERIAAAGPLLGPAPIEPATAPNPLIVRGPLSHREAGRRLVIQLDRAHLNPPALQNVMNRQALILAEAAQLVAQPQIAGRLARHAQQVTLAAKTLSAVAGGDHDVDRRAPAQAQLIAAYLTGAHLQALDRPEVGLDVARQAGPTMLAIGRAIRRQIRTGRWWVADGSDHDKPLWVRARIDVDPPDILAKLDALDSVARHLSAVVPAGRQAPRSVPPRVSLAKHDERDKRLGALSRPTTPSTRLAPSRTPER
jgi:hypothetical protein